MRLPHGFLEVIRAQPTGVPVDAAAGTLRVASGAVEVAASDAWVRLVQVAAPDGRAVAATDVPDLLALAQP